MTMVIDNQGRHYGTMSYDHMYSNPMQTSPNFNDPWSHQNNTSNQSYPSLSKSEHVRTTMSMPYSQMPPVTAPLVSGSTFSNTGYNGSDLLSLHQDIPRSTYGDHTYSSPATSSSHYATSSFPSLSYTQSLHQQQQHQQQHNKLTDPNENARAANASFGELDASRGMLALSHQNLQDMTPRNIFEARAQRESTESYGFPSTQSHHSSISNESGRGYPYYASSVGSVTDSATDYSSAASDGGYDSLASRTLPRPSQLMGAPLGPPAPQSMMGQFSSKLSANTQKKHKCKVCDKRFTRPSSLQTHMYSHTGEKPFACDVEGCGRHFSVVSNLRRHKKVHKGDSTSSTQSDCED